MANSDDGEDALYKVDTVPPPNGEADLYSAPTRVGAVGESEPLIASIRPAGLAVPKPARVPSFAPPALPPENASAGIVRIAHDEDTGEAGTTFYEVTARRVLGAPAKSPKKALLFIAVVVAAACSALALYSFLARHH